jgi:hypothetical protein
MSAASDTQALQHRASVRGMQLTIAQANTLRRAALTLHRWYELECGDGNQWGSWAIERDDNGDGPPFMVCHHYQHGRGKDYTTRRRLSDREAGARKRVAQVCQEAGCHFYHQTDPRGCPLYISTEPIADNDYTRALAVY